MQVSVIIPNYNHSAFLNERIDSILNQTYQDFEIIILDDCSTDNSREIIEAYRGHPNVSHVVFNIVNSGSVFRQWEKGILLAKGKYIWIAESDDYAMPDFLASLVPVLDSDTTIGFVYSDSFCITIKQGADISTVRYSELRNKMLNTHKWGSSYTNDGHREIKECLIDQCTVNNASAVLFRRSALERADPFDISFKYFGDWYCYMKICMEANVSYVNKPLNHYRDHANNASKNLKLQFTHIEEFFKIFNWALNNIDFIERDRIINKCKNTTVHSLRKNWNLKRLRLYGRLINLNPGLFIKMLRNNARHSYRSLRNN